MLWGVALPWGLARLDWILLGRSLTDIDYQSVGILDKPCHNVYIVSCGRQSGSIDPPDHRSITMKAVISAVAASAIKTYVDKSITASRAMAKVVDTLIADGIAPEMLEAPKKDQDRTFYDSVCGAVIAGFTTTVQSLLAKETKSLSDEQKGEKRYWQQQIGSKVKDIRNSLKRRLAKDEESDGANSTSTLESRLVRDLGKYVAQLQKVEGFKGDVAGVIKDLQSAIARVK